MNLLTDTFSLAVLTHSDTAVSHGIDNTPNAEQAANLRALYDNLLWPLVKALPNGDINVTVAFRCDKVNELVGGKPNSQHRLGMAADLEYYEGGKEDNMKIVNAVKNLGLMYDQIILENMKDGKPSWIHISYNHGKNRKQFLTL